MSAAPRTPKDTIDAPSAEGKSQKSFVDDVGGGNESVHLPKGPIYIREPEKRPISSTMLLRPSPSPNGDVEFNIGLAGEVMEYIEPELTASMCQEKIR